MGQARGNTLADRLGFTLIFGIVVGKRIQNEDLNETRIDSDRFIEFQNGNGRKAQHTNHY